MKKAMHMRPIEQLIEAMQIFAKYVGDSFPTNCEHDTLVVCVTPSEVSEEDRTRLAELGFSPDADDIDNAEHFSSFRFGSC